MAQISLPIVTPPTDFQKEIGYTSSGLLTITNDLAHRPENPENPDKWLLVTLDDKEAYLIPMYRIRLK